MKNTLLLLCYVIFFAFLFRWAETPPKKLDVSYADTTTSVTKIPPIERVISIKDTDKIYGDKYKYLIIKREPLVELKDGNCEFYDTDQICVEYSLHNKLYHKPIFVGLTVSLIGAKDNIKSQTSYIIKDLIKNEPNKNLLINIYDNKKSAIVTTKELPDIFHISGDSLNTFTKELHEAMKHHICKHINRK